MSPTHVVCLLPARNAAEDLPDYFASVGRFCDTIVALDDGSTDATGELLASCPLVKILLSNPRREDYRAWDDAANRARLLEAAATLDPAWIMSLDADERIPADDAAALRHFIGTEAVPGHAYGFNVCRMWGDLDHYVRPGFFAYRLFAYEPGMRFPRRRLHFVPVPPSIPRERRLTTTVRIQHLATLNEERRQSRTEKYRQADPDDTFTHRYKELTEPAGAVQPWEPRPPRLQVVGGPAMSAVVIARNDEDIIARCVASVVSQECSSPFETIVVTSGNDRTAEIVRERFPQVTVIELPRPAFPGEARNAGLRVARGEYVAFPDSHVELPPDSLAARLEAHEMDYAIVLGTTVNGTRTWAGWGSYFLDHSDVLPGGEGGERRRAPSHCSYLRAALEMVGGFREDMRAGEDTVLNQKLARLGYVTYREPEARIIHHSRCRTPRYLVRHHFERGRWMGRILLGRHGGQGRLVASIRPWFGFGYVPRRVSIIRERVRKSNRSLRFRYWMALPMIVLGAIAFWLGVWYELLRPGPRKFATLLGPGAPDVYSDPGRW